MPSYFLPFTGSFWLAMIIYWLVTATIWGFVVRSIIRSKGYDDLTVWFIIGFFLGFFGLIIALVRPSQRKPPFPGGNPYGHPPQANQYPYEQPHFQGQPFPTAQQSQSDRCPFCGMINPPDSAVCSQCGSKMN